MKTLLIMVVMVVSAITTGLPAQNYTADIQAALKVFELPKLQLNVEVNVYPFYASQEPSQVYKAELKKDGNSFYSKLDNTRMLLNDKYLVMVYDDDKRVICTERDKKSEKAMRKNSDPTEQIDTLLKKNDSIVYGGITGNAKVYTIYTNKSIIRRTEIHLDVKTGYISSLVYYYNEQLVPNGNKVRVDYVTNTAPVFSASEFSEKRFVVFGRGDAVTAGSECSNYNVIYVDPKTSTATEK